MRIKNITSTLSAFVSASLLCACTQPPAIAPADIILSNGYIYTVDGQRTVAQSMAIRAGKIVYIGGNQYPQALRGPETKITDLGGKMVMPGLHDMHIHALGSVKPDMCDIDGKAMSLDAMVPFIKSCIETYGVSENGWLPVLQWNPFEGNQPTQQYPNIRAALDAVSKDVRIMMWGNDGHHGAANTAALNSPAVAVNAKTLTTTYRDYHGLIEVDANGEPSGGLNESARNIVRADMDRDMLGVSTAKTILMPKVAAKMAANGITSIQDAAVTKEILEYYQWLDASGAMTFRLRTALIVNPGESKLPTSLEKIPEYIAQLKAMRKSVAGSKFIQANGIKIFADGVLEGNPHNDPPSTPNAALIDGFRQPVFSSNEHGDIVDIKGYIDLNSAACRAVQVAENNQPGKVDAAAFKQQHGYQPTRCLKQYGKLVGSEAIIKELVKQATEAGFHIHVHAISDRAVKVAADAFEPVKVLADQKGLTQSVAHMQIAKTADIKRHGKLGSYIVFTYLWAGPEPAYDMTVIPFLDKVEGIDDLYNSNHYYLRNAYPVKSIQNHGAKPVFGSDVPVGNRNPRPFENMQMALSRESGGIVLNAAERLNIHQAIASFTINSAGLMARAQELGSLEEGKIADVIILDRNIVELYESGRTKEIAKTQVLTTIFDGRVVYQKK